MMDSKENENLRDKERHSDHFIGDNIASEATQCTSYYNQSSNVQNLNVNRLEQSNEIVKGVGVPVDRVFHTLMSNSLKSTDSDEDDFVDIDTLYTNIWYIALNNYI